MSNYNQKRQKVENQVNADNIEQEIENSGTLSQEINAKKVHIGDKPITCPKCKTSNKYTSRFCKSCGSSLTKICKVCWTENDLSTTFCTNCGVEVDSSRFSISPQQVAIFKDKFAEAGWRASSIDRATTNALEKMGRPINKQETVILSATITGDSLIYKVSVNDKSISSLPILKSAISGTFRITNQRIILCNLIDGWIASYPHEYLVSLVTSQEKHLAGIEVKESFIISLNYNKLGTIKIYKELPPKPSVYWGSDPQLELQRSMLNASAIDLWKSTSAENLLFTRVFQHIVDIRKNHIKDDSHLSIDNEQFFRNAPEILPSLTTNSSKSSSASNTTKVISAGVVIGIWIFITLCFGILIFANGEFLR